MRKKPVIGISAPIVSFFCLFFIFHVEAKAEDADQGNCYQKSSLVQINSLAISQQFFTSQWFKEKPQLDLVLNELQLRFSPDPFEKFAINNDFISSNYFYFHSGLSPPQILI